MAPRVSRPRSRSRSARSQRGRGLAGRIIGWVCAIGALGVVGVGIAGQLARYRGGLDIINQFAPLWLLAGLALVLGAVTWRGAQRYVGWGAWAALLILIGVLMGPEFFVGRSKPDPTGDGETLRIVQFNIWKNNATPEIAARWVKAQAPDIIVLTEGARSAWPAVQTLKRDYPFVVGCLRRNKPCSTMIMARKAPIASDGLARGDPENRQALSAAWATFEGKGGPYTVVAVHMPRPGELQQEQRMQLASFVDELPKGRLIVAGDFNAAPWSFALKRTDTALGLERRTRGLSTWPALVGEEVGRPFPFPFLPLDHLYAGPGWATSLIERGPRLGSDHYPVTIELTAR